MTSLDAIEIDLRTAQAGLAQDEAARLQGLLDVAKTVLQDDAPAEAKVEHLRTLLDA